MTDTPNKPRSVIVDPFPVSGLTDLYKSKAGIPLKKSALNDRMTSLGIKSFAQPGQGSKRFIRAADVLRLNTLDAYIHENGTMTGFPGLITASSGNNSVPDGDSLEVFEDEEIGELGQAIRQEQRLAAASTSRSSSEDMGDVTLWQALTKMTVQDAIGQWVKPLQSIFYPTHKKTEDAIRTFSLAVEKEAVLSTSQIADLLNVGTGVFSGKKSVTRMGFKFVRLGREGRETGWRVVKAKLPPLED